MSHAELLKEYERVRSQNEVMKSFFFIFRKRRSPNGIEKNSFSQKLFKDKKIFMESWFRYCMSRGEDHLLKNLPINKKTGKILDMYRLYAAMTCRGGSSKVVKDKKMKFVTSYMGFEHTSEIASALKIIYRKYLYAFEQKAMFQRDIPIVRVFFSSSSCVAYSNTTFYHQVKNEMKPKTIFSEPSRIVTFDVTSEKKSEVDFQDLYDALKSSQHERNLWALKSLLRITTLQECGGEPVSMPGSVRSIERVCSSI